MLGPAASARSNTSSKAGASAAARDAASHAQSAADKAVARCTATDSCVHQRRAQAAAAAWLRRTNSRTRARAPVPQRPPTSEPTTTRRWGPLRSSSGYVASSRRVAVANAAPSVSVERPCGWPSRDTGETKVASQSNAVNDHVESAAVIERHARSSRVREPLLRNDLPFGPDGFACHATWASSEGMAVSQAPAWGPA